MDQSTYQAESGESPPGSAQEIFPGSDLSKWRRSRTARPGLHVRAARKVSDDLFNVFLFGASATVLGIARWLNPSPAGVGTHTQLGLPSCGFLQATGMPCPACGMTTSFAHAAHGHLFAAFHTQPAGATLAILTAAMLIASVYGMISGRSLSPLIDAVMRPVPMIALAAIILAGWMYKILLVTGT